MISQREMLDIIRTEAIEYGGLQELPSQQRGGKTSFHAAKRVSRGMGERNGRSSGSDSPKVKYKLRVTKKGDGKLQWKD
jgi:hypothetical protein